MAPPPRSFIDGTAARTMRSVLNSSRSIASCHAASSNEIAAPAGGPPALVNSRSTPPNRSIVCPPPRRDLIGRCGRPPAVASTCDAGRRDALRGRVDRRLRCSTRSTPTPLPAPAPPRRRSRARGSRRRPSRPCLSARDPFHALSVSSTHVQHAVERLLRRRVERRRRARASRRWRARRGGAALPCGSPCRCLPGTRTASAAPRDRRRRRRRPSRRRGTVRHDPTRISGKREAGHRAGRAGDQLLEQEDTAEPAEDLHGRCRRAASRMRDGLERRRRILELDRPRRRDLLRDAREQRRLHREAGDRRIVLDDDRQIDGVGERLVVARRRRRS